MQDERTAPETEAAETAEAAAPETETVETAAPETEAAETAETAAPETEAAETAETAAPETEAVEGEAPETEEAPAPAAEDGGTAAIPPVKRIKPPYHERYYLLYGAAGPRTELDLQGTKAFLQNMGFDGGELRQARHGKAFAGLMQSAGEGDGTMARCSYCGCEITGVEYHQLPDGRLRCTSCSSTVVRTQAEVQAVLDRVLSNLESFFGASIHVPISIELLEERKLKRKLKQPLSQVDDQSVLILGVAVNRKKQYSILLENGAPRISLMATFAHELTHIWQYLHWDGVPGFRRCSPAKRLLIYEGMAKWAEIQYLYLIGETAAAQREEAFTRNREDAYGVGFCLYADQFPLTREAMTCNATPFTPGRYPFEESSSS